jgi:spermidine synthase
MRRHALALGLMTASGFAGLGYQIVWTQQGGLWLGHEAASVLAVVAAFFGGLAVGAFALGGRIERSARPQAWYAGCEAAIGLWGLVLAFAMAPASAGLLQLTGAEPSPLWQWTVAFGGTFMLLLPATAAMGATLPAMERLVSGLQRSGIGALYAANTAGAVLGVLASAFWLLPSFGLRASAIACVALNLACAIGALALKGDAVEPQPVPEARGASALLATMLATGLLGIGYEVLAVRVLSQVAENTVYTFALLLAVYLVGTTLGAAAYQRWGRGGDAEAMGRRLLHALAFAGLLGLGGLWGAEALKLAVVQAFGPGMASALAAEAATAVAAFLLPTLLMGALFSHLSAQARAQGVGFARALGFNTLGAAVAPVLFGVLLVPLLGLKASLLGVIAGYLVLAAPRAWRSAPSWSGAAVLLAIALVAPPLAFIDVPDGGRLVSYREGSSASVSVVEDAQGIARLRIDNREQEGTSATRFADARQAWLPLLLHPRPRHVLFLGLGTGVTARSAARDPALRVDAVELLPPVIEASREFAQRVFRDQPSQLHVIAADARRYVRASPQHYDVIVADNFHPARSGSGALYTVEHFEAVRARLAPGGLFCQWLPLHQLDLPTLRSIVRAFLAAYPQGQAMLATNSLQTPVIGLVARADGRRFNLDAARERLRHAAAAAGLGLDDEYALFGSFIAGPQALAQWAGDAALNTDDHPVVAYLAPRGTYAPDSLPVERLLALLHEVDVRPAEVVGTVDALSAQRLAAYWRARDSFLAAGRGVQPSADPRRMLAQVGQPLLDVLRASPDFRPAYDPLLRIAGALVQTDPTAARALLAELARVQPARPEAVQALRELGTAH